VAPLVEEIEKHKKLLKKYNITGRKKHFQKLKEKHKNIMNAINELKRGGIFGIDDAVIGLIISIISIIINLAFAIADRILAEQKAQREAQQRKQEQDNEDRDEKLYNLKQMLQDYDNQLGELCEEAKMNVKDYIILNLKDESSKVSKMKDTILKKASDFNKTPIEFTDYCNDIAKGYSWWNVSTLLDIMKEELQNPGTIAEQGEQNEQNEQAEKVGGLTAADTTQMEKDRTSFTDLGEQFNNDLSQAKTYRNQLSLPQNISNNNNIVSILRAYHQFVQNNYTDTSLEQTLQSVEDNPNILKENEFLRSHLVQQATMYNTFCLWDKKGIYPFYNKIMNFSKYMKKQSPEALAPTGGGIYDSEIAFLKKLQDNSSKEKVIKSLGNRILELQMKNV
jgi:hypothetical protein